MPLLSSRDLLQNLYDSTFEMGKEKKVEGDRWNIYKVRYCKTRFNLFCMEGSQEINDYLFLGSQRWLERPFTKLKSTRVLVESWRHDTKPSINFLKWYLLLARQTCKESTGSPSYCSSWMNGKYMKKIPSYHFILFGSNIFYLDRGLGP